MKKIVLLALAALLISMPVYAGQTGRNVFDAERISISDQTIETDVNVARSDRVSFFVLNDSSLPTEGVTCSVTAAFSYDGTNWVDAYWYDFAGGTTLQSSENLGVAGKGDGYYFGWFNPNMAIKYIKFKVSLDSTAAGQIGAAAYNDITITVVEDK